jgi:hypothetical protein
VNASCFGAQPDCVFDGIGDGIFKLMVGESCVCGFQGMIRLPLSNTNVKKATLGWLSCICSMAERSRAPAGPASGIRSRARTRARAARGTWANPCASANSTHALDSKSQLAQLTFLFVSRSRISSDRFLEMAPC